MKPLKPDGNVEQFNGREGETATLLSRCLVTFNELGGGFAPLHLKRWTSFPDLRWKLDEDSIINKFT